ncbi:hypothetical protein SAMN04488511_101467 [Pedobacter suwonensis]|uniref:Uncharacterized protein n=1 Tax=Pedobacter suwonensis TaxID=332999 RepID=A0A1I0SJ52_9SPHI|nr:hypothetical protein SAMN04488511_101467 [Pedobacter suwonensis]
MIINDQLFEKTMLNCQVIVYSLALQRAERAFGLKGANLK